MRDRNDGGHGPGDDGDEHGGDAGPASLQGKHDDEEPIRRNNHHEEHTGGHRHNWLQ